MNEDVKDEGEAIADTLPLLLLLTGYWISPCVQVAARLGIADLLAGGAQTAEELAESCGASPEALRRVLRTLAGFGVFSENPNNKFSLNPLAQCLRSDAPGSIRSVALVTGEPWMWKSFGNLMHSVKTGDPAFNAEFGMPLFEYFARNPDTGELFDRSMTELAPQTAGMLIDSYDFSTVDRVVDVGGNLGRIIEALAREYPKLKGVVFDLPEVAERTTTRFRTVGLGDRCSAVGGVFSTPFRSPATYTFSPRFYTIGLMRMPVESCPICMRRCPRLQCFSSPARSCRRVRSSLLREYRTSICLS